MAGEIRYPEEVRIDSMERRLQRVVRSIQIMEVRKFELQTEIKRAALARPAADVADRIIQTAQNFL